ncbi:hypothetical protein HN51_053552 [Arachis hypogaea]|uniref:FBD-associated F-box protein At4g10400-like n=1 Tax=Arachis ipaensis TaxID=130454 RepID=UPI0007AF1759|nr:FBD-associated F-box protein At4g10400-like [Arachis ipaensis]XP_025674399.1 FBD-associated F-box protein At4g10400 [Arachis hypogaea]
MVEPPWQPKQLRLENNNTDRISALPNTVLCYILSFVPTKTAVRTSVLSPRWRHVWKDVKTLHFSDDSHELFDETGESFKRFSIFVNNVFNLHNDPRDIHALRLSCGHSNNDPLNASSVAAWVRAAIGPNLEEFHLTLFCNDARGFVVPHNILSCSKLVTLSLSGGVHLLPKQPLTVDLVSLKILSLDIDDVDWIDGILSKCPQIETLSACFTLRQPVRVCLPLTLKKLKFAIKNQVAAAIEIHAQGLTYISIAHAANRFSYRVSEMNNVREVSLNMYATHEPIDVLIRILIAVRRTEILALHRFTTKWLLRAQVPVFPDFHHLIRLEVVLPWFNSSFLMSLLSKCHKLQELKIEIDEELPIVSQSWMKPRRDLPCLASYLSCFHFVGYRGIHDESKIVGYILERGLLLSTIIIDLEKSLDDDSKNDVLMKLLAMPRGSPLCEINIC